MRKWARHAYRIRIGASVAALAVAVTAFGWSPQSAAQQVDAFWPQWFPNQWGIGQVHGVAVDSRDHVWILQRQRTLTADEAGLTNGRSWCCARAPAVMEFDPAGNFVQGWGGPFDPGFIEQRCVEPGCQWPAAESGLFLDDNGFVYIAGTQGGAIGDHMVLKFTRDGTFVMQIGARGLRGMSNDTNSAPGGRPALGNPVRMAVDVAANELYIADGLANRRVLVVDATTGLYKRHWGAYGNVPSDAALPAYDPNVVDTQFRQVHCVRIADDGLVYVCDRTANRVQVFRKDGTFVREFFVDRNTLGNGSAWDIAFSRDPGQYFLYLADGENNLVRIYDRARQAQVGTFGRQGRHAGDFHWVHSLGISSKGEFFAGEADTGKRVQKFVGRGARP